MPTSLPPTSPPHLGNTVDNRQWGTQDSIVSKTIKKTSAYADHLALNELLNTGIWMSYGGGSLIEKSDMCVAVGSVIRMWAGEMKR